MLQCLRVERRMAMPGGGGGLKVLAVPEPLHVHLIPFLVLIFTSTGQLELISSGWGSSCPGLPQ